MKPGALLLVGAGGAAGALARYLAGLFITARLGFAWPFATFAINITGCFLIGFFLTLAADRIPYHESWRLFFPVGFVGAYTTFSTYEYETVRLVEDGHLWRALSYVLASTIAGFLAVILAIATARRF